MEGRYQDGGEVSQTGHDILQGIIGMTPLLFSCFTIFYAYSVKTKVWFSFCLPQGFFWFCRQLILDCRQLIVDANSLICKDISHARFLGICNRRQI